MLFMHLIRNMSALLFLRLMHFFPCRLLSASHVFFQFSTVLLLVSGFGAVIAAILLKFAHSVSYTVAVIIFIKDLSGHSIIRSFHLDVTIKLFRVV